jgi:hypothetical protein
MKHKMTQLLLISVVCLHGSSLVGQPVKVDPFHSVIVSSEIIAELVLSANEAILPDFDNASEEDLIAEVSDSLLRLRMRTGRYKDSKLDLKIYYSGDLRLLEASGRAQIWSEEELYYDGNLSTRVSNGGEIRLRLFCDSLNAKLTQGSIIHLKGEARALNVTSTTGATFSGYEFETRKADANAGSGGKIKLSVSDYLNANASSKGFIGYVGDPGKVDQKTSLKGEILKTYLE